MTKRKEAQIKCCLQSTHAAHSQNVHTYQAADFLEHFLVCHGARLIQLVALPEEAGLIATALLDMPVQAVVCHVGAPSFEVLHLDLAIVPVEVRLRMLLLELQTQ